MEIPDQVVDELRGEAPATRWLLICIYRYGRPVVDHETGGRRVHLKASQRRLERLTGISKRAIVDAQRALLEGGFVRVHAPLRPGAAQSISAPVDRAGGANFAPPARFGAASHGDGDPDPNSRPQGEVITTTIPPGSREEAVQLLHRLQALGLNNAHALIERFGLARCAAATAIVESAPTATNPPGLLVSLLRSGRQLANPRTTSYADLRLETIRNSAHNWPVISQ